MDQVGKYVYFGVASYLVSRY